MVACYKTRSCCAFFRFYMVWPATGMFCLGNTMFVISWLICLLSSRFKWFVVDLCFCEMEDRFIFALVPSYIFCCCSCLFQWWSWQLDWFLIFCTTFQFSCAWLFFFALGTRGFFFLDSLFGATESSLARFSALLWTLLAASWWARKSLACQYENASSAPSKGSINLSNLSWDSVL